MKKVKVKASKLEKMQKYAEKLLECIEMVMDEDMGERRNDDDDDDDDEDEDEEWVMMGGRGSQGGSGGGMRMGERRSRGRNGRYR